MSRLNDRNDEDVRDVYAVTPLRSSNRGEPWERMASEVSSMSTEFNGLVMAGSVVATNGGENSEENVLGNRSLDERGDEGSVQRVKREEVESKIMAWQNAKIAKINNRFKREDAIINGWETDKVQTSTAWMNNIERKLEEKRARAMEKMENEKAKARRRAEEKKATAEAKRGTKVGRVIEVANFMRAVGRPPLKRYSFFI